MTRTRGSSLNAGRDVKLVARLIAIITAGITALCLSVVSGSAALANTAAPATSPPDTANCGYFNDWYLNMDGSSHITGDAQLNFGFTDNADGTVTVAASAPSSLQIDHLVIGQSSQVGYTDTYAYSVVPGSTTTQVQSSLVFVRICAVNSAPVLVDSEPCHTCPVDKSLLFKQIGKLTETKKAHGKITLNIKLQCPNTTKKCFGDLYVLSGSGFRAITCAHAALVYKPGETRVAHMQIVPGYCSSTIKKQKSKFRYNWQVLQDLPANGVVSAISHRGVKL